LEIIQYLLILGDRTLAEEPGSLLIGRTPISHKRSVFDRHRPPRQCSTNSLGKEFMKTFSKTITCLRRVDSRKKLLLLSFCQRRKDVVAISHKGLNSSTEVSITTKSPFKNGPDVARYFSFTVLTNPG
jgi:hypothetical protein